MLSELRDRLRAGDVWVRGSRRYRNFEDCLLPKPTFAALRAEGPLPVGVEEDVERHLATRCDALAAATEDVAVLAKAGQLPDAARAGLSSDVSAHWLRHAHASQALQATGRWASRLRCALTDTNLRSHDG